MNCEGTHNNKFIFIFEGTVLPYIATYIRRYYRHKLQHSNLYTYCSIFHSGSDNVRK